MKYSIITPVKDSIDSLKQNMLSILYQTSRDWEHIIVDDCSIEPIGELVKKFQDDLPEKYQYIRNEQNFQRAVCRNKGMKIAKGDWICWLDADDFYLPSYLAMMDQAIEQNPEVKVFNTNGIVIWNNWGTEVRKSREFKQNEQFKSGQTMSGAFVFHKSCLQKVGFLPEASDPYAFGREMKLIFPEVSGLYPDKDDLGNPWGDDWAMFYKLTREYQPKYLDTAPYVVNIRGERNF